MSEKQPHDEAASPGLPTDVDQQGSPASASSIALGPYDPAERRLS